MLRRSFLAALLSAASVYSLGIGDYVHAGLDFSNNAASAASSASTSTGSQLIEPCAIIGNASSYGVQHFNATIAYQCLQSVPLNATAAALQLDGVRFFMQFQSTLGYLADPPIGYLYPPVDIMDALARLAFNLRNGQYQGEYAFQQDLHAILASAHEEHLWYYIDINSIFIFYHDAQLYSISKDGVSVPEVYLKWDVDNTQPDDFASSTNISPITKINGQDVETYLNQLAILSGSAQDPDANYNSLFGNNSLYSLQNTYTGDRDEIVFKNGSSIDVKVSAFSKFDLSSLTDGPSFFTAFLAEYESSDLDGEPGLSTETSSVRRRSEPSSTTSAGTRISESEIPFSPLPVRPPTYGPAYPIVETRDGSVQGYLPTTNKDLAVLRIPTFMPKSAREFSNTVRVFLATAEAYNRTKLVIDLRGNGGGEIALGYDLFAQLFPNILPYGASNIRVNPFIDQAGQLISEYFSPYTNTTAPDSMCQTGAISSILNYHEQYTMNNTNYTSWNEYYGPYTSVGDTGDQFTSLARYNLNDKFTLGCAKISNYGNLKGITPQVFQAENIVLLQDGNCASTCSTFSEFMKSQAQVRSIVVGGRAQQAPMQAVGGTKGANEWPWIEVWVQLEEALQDATELTDDWSGALAATLTSNLAAAEPGVRQALSRSLASIGPSLNFRNNIRPNDQSVTPMQFVYEAAGCRLFYTLATLQYPSLLWDAAYKVSWTANGSSLCVPGSTGDPSADPNTAGTNVPPASAENFFGATVLSPLPSSLQGRVPTSLHNANTTATNSSAAAAATPSAKKSEAAMMSGPALRTSMIGFAIAVAGVMIML